MVLALPPGILTLETVSGNWTCPDNVWCAHSDTDPVISCDVNAALHPLLSNHLPIITIIELPIAWTSSPPSPDFQDVDWEKFDASLSSALDLCSPAWAITSKADFDSKVDLLTIIIQETISTHIPEKKPTPFSKCWWCSELKELKIKKNKLSYEAYKFRDIQDHPAKQEHAAACCEFTEAIKNKHIEHWIDWLENTKPHKIYITNKYVTNDPSDFSCTRVPDLKTMNNDRPTLASTNSAKALALSSLPLPTPLPSQWILTTPDPSQVSVTSPTAESIKQSTSLSPSRPRAQTAFPM
ncbi:hypothetical protein L208DRAFT_1240640 [Tricholoma matsutake]|nr:hypothetical protein L208DRAFT_1240640 [Tricholoma matsutake 945]